MECALVTNALGIDTWELLLCLLIKITEQSSCQSLFEGLRMWRWCPQPVTCPKLSVAPTTNPRRFWVLQGPTFQSVMRSHGFQCSKMTHLMQGSGASLDKGDPQISLVHRMANRTPWGQEAAWNAIVDRERVAGISTFSILPPHFHSCLSEPTGTFIVLGFYLLQGAKGPWVDQAGQGPDVGAHSLSSYVWVTCCFLQKGLRALNIRTQKSYLSLPGTGCSRNIFSCC